MTGDPSMMAEALLWACGLDAERPAPQLVAGSQFRELVTLHKIAGRLLNRRRA
jgi:hypothetical protein